MDILFLLAVTLVIIWLSIWFRKRRKLMSTFKKFGIPGPEPNLIFGNLTEFNKKGLILALKDWEKQYGKVFGYYLGALPLLSVSDIEMLKDIQIRDFNNFTDRPVLVPGGLVGNEQLTTHLFSAKGNKWKLQRGIMTPTFSTSKMKQMVPLMNASIDTFMANLEVSAKCGENIEICNKFKGLTLDVIAKTAFGTETDVQTNKNSKFLLGVQDLLVADTFTGFVMLLVSLPELKFILQPIRKFHLWIQFTFGLSRMFWFLSTCIEIISTRRLNPNVRRQDLLQLLVDAELSKEEMKNLSSEKLTADYNNDDKPEQIEVQDKPKQIGGHKLTDDEVTGNGFIMMLAGYETTSTALSFMTHILVNNLDIQEKIRQEIKELLTEEGELNYNTVAKLKYMDQIWSENLRFYAPVPSFVNRIVNNEIQYGKWTIPKGVSVQIPVPLLHRNPEYWKDPDTFDTERFSADRKSEIHPMAYQPFGAGPRNCIGMRFALLEAKLALARILNEYRLLPCEKTETGDLEVTVKFVIMCPKNGVYVRAEKIER